uniref:Uncharacterized protein n=1 Tax=Trypanosoma vivax (strain Y486) TaxID=1055687 RepID=G0TS33_TRYVY|nr:conserved hypothetical protein, in T. vivax [Trypanosoma vivax Y486]
MAWPHPAHFKLSYALCARVRPKNGIRNTFQVHHRYFPAFRPPAAEEACSAPAPQKTVCGIGSAKRGHTIPKQDVEPAIGPSAKTAVWWMRFFARALSPCASKRAQID